MKRMAAWTAACLALAIVGCHKETAPPGEGSAGTAPFLVQFEAERVDGGKVTLEALKGRVVLVDLFGTWCPPCRRATPVIVSLYERYRTQGFEVVGLAYERTETVEAAKEAVLAFKKEYGVPYVLAIGPEAVKGQIPGGFEGYPTMVLVDRQGVGRRHFVGFSPGEEAALTEEIEKLLAEPASGAK
jgi:thiol-disulfide isomerase/thioredoxin